jgi:cobalt-zinc-cadmium efflux system membrane fusion protein
LQTQVKALGLKLEMIGCDLKALAKGNMNAVLAVKSPIDGYIEEQYLAIGKYVTPADILVKIVGTLDKHVEVKVFEKDLSKLKLGQTILVEAEGLRVKAKIFLIGQQVNLETRTTSVHGHFEKIADEKLFTVGQFVSAKITVGSKFMSAVPQAALARVGKAGFIYIESSAGTMKQIPVEILSSTKDLVGIKPLVNLPEGKLVISGASALEAIFAKD